MKSGLISDQGESDNVLNENGFFSIDAFFAILLVTMVAGSLLTVTHNSREAARETAGVVRKDMIAEKLAGVINSVYANGSKLKLGENDSLEICISLPDNILGEDYTLLLNQENRVIFAENSKAGLKEPIATASVVPNNIQSFVLRPENLSRRIRIFWENDRIKVKSC